MVGECGRGPQCARAARGLPGLPLRHLASRAHRAPTILGRQVHRAIRSGLHPTEARLQSRSHHHTQVVAERDPGPSRQTALTCTTAPRRHRAAQVILNLTPRAYDSNYNGRYHGTDIILNH